MPVPWMQIVRLMPSIVDVSRELLKRTRRKPEGAPGTDLIASGPALESRVAALEENERRQAELVNNMADQQAQLTAAVTALHIRMRWLVAGLIVTSVIAIVAIGFALR